jgi:hypothetical protein
MSGGGAADASGEDEVGVEELLPPSAMPAPDVACAAAEFEAQIRHAVGHMPDADDCLDAMLAHETPTETAHRLGLPVHRVYYVRQQIRGTAAALLGREEGE